MKTKCAFLLILLSALALDQSTLAAGRGGGGGRAGGSGSYHPASGGTRPAIAKPSGGGGRLPDYQPAQRPSLPQTKPAQRPAGSGGGLPGLGSAEHERPRLPGHPAQKPAVKPGAGGDFIGMKPDQPGRRPTTLPGNISAGDRPGRPTTLPGNTGGHQPNRPGLGDGHRPNLDNRPGHAPRPARPDRPDKWQNIQDNNSNQWNSWRQKNEISINNFQVNRTNNWNNVNARYNEHNWAGRFGSAEYRNWSNDVWSYRLGRCEEIWSRRQDFWDDCFDNHWWGSCWWRPRPYVTVGVGASPWWWRPFAWAGAGAFFGATLATEPVIYDPGTTVIYVDDTYYVDGKASGTATAARQSAMQLATPDVEETPVPDPAAEGQPEAWMPLGVWALTQQEQGDATMFMQFSVNRDGLLAGAYKNVMTGDEQPIVGQIDKKTQRIAWHIGQATQTVYETGLSGLDNDVCSVFVHFGEKQTQTWLLVRLPSLELPPGTVKLPGLKK